MFQKNVLILYLALIINGIESNSSKGLLKKIYKKVYHIDKKIEDKFGYGILITGGRDETHTATTSVEVILPDGRPVCIFETSALLRLKNRGHSLNGRLLCGGIDENDDAINACDYFQNGIWSQFAQLSIDRAFHIGWDTPNGDTILFGGFINPNTTTVVKQSGQTVEDKFPLPIPIINSCGIEFEDFILITGGKESYEGNPLNQSSIYSSDGFINQLSQLNVARYGHGCGSFYDGDKNLVFIVTAGSTGNNLQDNIKSTEILRIGIVDEWELLGEEANYPRFLKNIRGFSINNDIFMTGGITMNDNIINDVYKFDKIMLKWFPKKFGMAVPRDEHALTILQLNEIEPFCLQQ